ncbi:glycosyltransferase family 2 protein [Flavobacterium sp. UBA6031]|uniref:glycosyltransferase family 2 protein n=1 Tax=Flavobacterium sp. UBA6031 TaxID=1946551 RepID=UPI0025C05F88|nr:glycosyltransferase family 2 protein [Flavobacterium sp. UBA6031]
MSSISIVIPTYNRQKSLNKCLSCINAQTKLSSLENIYLVNDGQSSIEDIANKYDFLSSRIIILKTNGIGPAAARNKAIEFIKSKYVAFLDDDSYPQISWLFSCEKLFDENPFIIAQLGKILWDNKENHTTFLRSFIPKLRQKIYDYRDCMYQNNEFIHEIIKIVNFKEKLQVKGLSNHISGGNFAIKRSFFTEHGGFNLNYFTYHDKELAYRILNNNGIIAYNPQMEVFHAHDPSILRSIKRGAFTVKFKLLLQKEYENCKWASNTSNMIDPKLLNLSKIETLFFKIQRLVERIVILYLKLNNRNE